MELSEAQKKKLISAAEIVDKGDMAVLTKIMEFQDFLEKYEQDKEQMDECLAKLDEFKKLCIDSDNEIIQEANIALSSLETSLKSQITASQGTSTEQFNTFKTSIGKQLEEIKASIPTMPDLSYYADRLVEIENKIPEIKETILDTPTELRDKLESLKEDERLDISAIKGLSQYTTQADLNRAIEILDKRTQYLLNKPSATVTSSGGGTGTVTSVATDATLTGGTITTTGTLGLNLANANVWTVLQTVNLVGLAGTTSDGLLISNNTAATAGVTQQVSPAIHWSGQAWATTPVVSQDVSFRAVVAPNSGATATGSWILQSSLAGAAFSSKVTVTDAGATTIVGNVTAPLFISNNASGAIAFQSSATSTTSNFASATTGAGATTAAGLLFGGASTINYRVVSNGTTSTTLGTGNSYGALIIGSQPITTFSSGTHAWLANAVVKSLGTVTSGGAAVTNTASLYIEGASAAGTNNYSVYSVSGNNFFGGQISTPLIINPNNAITASANAATVPVTSSLSTVTNNSAATLTITMATSGAVDGQKVVVRILDFSAVPQTLVFVNTENSDAVVPATSNGSTTLPRTVGFMYNAATSKWRCLANA